MRYALLVQAEPADERRAGYEKKFRAESRWGKRGADAIFPKFFPENTLFFLSESLGYELPEQGEISISFTGVMEVR